MRSWPKSLTKCLSECSSLILLDFSGPFSTRTSRKPEHKGQILIRFFKAGFGKLKKFTIGLTYLKNSSNGNKMAYRRRKILVMGLSGTGKTSLSNKLAPMIGAVHFNADDVRRHISNDLGFSHADRIEQARRMSWLCDKVVEVGGTAIADLYVPRKKRVPFLNPLSRSGSTESKLRNTMIRTKCLLYLASLMCGYHLGVRQTSGRKNRISLA